jgi:Transposase DDE domain
VAEDPDSEIITATVVTAGNVGDADPAADLLADILPTQTETTQTEVYGDAAYGTGPLLATLAEAGIVSMVKVQPASAPGGRFTKDAFSIDLEAGQVTCPNQVSAAIRPQNDGSGVARFGSACATCPLAARCTTAKDGREIKVSAYEEHLARGRADSGDPAWLATYRATRPKVERKLAHLTRRRHGGRRARVRGRAKVGADFSLLAAAVNLARLGMLGIASTVDGTWMAVTA